MIVPRSKSALRFNPILYGILVFFALLQFFVFDDLTWAVITLNLALVFDPFNPQQAWGDRPIWQRIWLFVHVSAGIGLLIFLAAIKIWFEG